jgi:2,5-diketo-D-gluconate reductase A
MQVGEALRAFEGESSEVLVTSKLNRCSTTPR